MYAHKLRPLGTGVQVASEWHVTIGLLEKSCLLASRARVG